MGFIDAVYEVVIKIILSSYIAAKIFTRGALDLGDIAEWPCPLRYFKLGYFYTRRDHHRLVST